MKPYSATEPAIDKSHLKQKPEVAPAPTVELPEAPVYTNTTDTDVPDPVHVNPETGLISTLQTENSPS